VAVRAGDQPIDRDVEPGRELGALVMSELKKLDQVAYVRFASVYRDFRDVDDFAQEIRSLKGHKD
jgi:transcriptional repressor NrdR